MRPPKLTIVLLSSMLLPQLLLMMPTSAAQANEPAPAEDSAVEVTLDQGADGIQQIFQRCFVTLREAGHDADRMSEREIAACMQPEIEAMAEFAYEISTAYAVSSLTRVALETCTLEQGNALAEPRGKAAERDARKLTWRWLSDCVKEVRWLKHDEQSARLERARRAAERIEDLRGSKK